MNKYDTLMKKLDYCILCTPQKDIEKEPKYRGFALVGNGEIRYFASLQQMSEVTGYTMKHIYDARIGRKTALTNDGYTIFRVTPDWKLVK